MIIVANNQVDSLYGFSKDFFTFLGWIKGGYDWLNWATTQTKSIVCRANDEKQLLQIIQTGLHSNDTIKFENFEMGIEKALTIDTADLTLLYSASNSTNESNSATEAVQSKWNLLSNHQLETNTAFLSKNSLSSDPIFTRLGLSDSIVLYKLQSSISNKKINQKALEFATKNAATTEEFSDFYNFYLSAIAQCPKNMTVAQKQNICLDLYAKYDTVCNYLITSPNVGTGNTDQELKEGLVLFVRAQKFIGFKTKAAAMYNLVSNVPINEDKSLNEDAIEAYMASIKSQITSATSIPDCQISQDGNERIFSIQNNSSKILVSIDKTGNIYILPSSIIKT